MPAAPSGVVDDRVRCAGVAVADHQAVDGRRLGQAVARRGGNACQPGRHRPVERAVRGPAARRAGSAARLRSPGPPAPGRPAQCGSTAERPGRPAVCSQSAADTEDRGTAMYRPAQRQPGCLGGEVARPGLDELGAGHARRRRSRTSPRPARCAIPPAPPGPRRSRLTTAGTGGGIGGNRHRSTFACSAAFMTPRARFTLLLPSAAPGRPGTAARLHSLWNRHTAPPFSSRA